MLVKNQHFAAADSTEVSLDWSDQGDKLVMERTFLIDLRFILVAPLASISAPATSI